MGKVRELGVIEDGTVLKLASNKSVVNEFPFLAPVARLGVGGCGGCARRRQQAAQLVNAAKIAIVQLPAAKKNRLKVILQAKQLRVHYYQAVGLKKQLGTHTF